MNDHTDNTHGEGGGLPPPFDTNRHVYSVEVTYTVTAKLYVLAHHAEEALRLAEQRDLDDMIGFDDTQVWIDFDDRLSFDDVTPSLTGNVNTTPFTEYDPKDHPRLESGAQTMTTPVFTPSFIHEASRIVERCSNEARDATLNACIDVARDIADMDGTANDIVMALEELFARLKGLPQ